MTDDHDPRDVRDVLADQNGSLTRAQALACGLSSSAIGRRVRRGDWRRGHPRVIEATDRPDDDRERIRRAGLWAGDTGTVAGLGAAAWWRLHDTVPHAAVDLGLTDGARLMDRALQTGAVTAESLRDALGRRGDAWGTPLARRLIGSPTAVPGPRRSAARSGACAAPACAISL